VELIKQTELQDFLRDRCSVESARRRQSRAAARPAPRMYYPIILPDRLELLLETAARHRAPHEVALRRRARCAQVLAYRDRAAQPAQPLPSRGRRRAVPLADRAARCRSCCRRRASTTLVAVPDGVLRLLPLASAARRHATGCMQRLRGGHRAGPESADRNDARAAPAADVSAGSPAGRHERARPGARQAAAPVVDSRARSARPGHRWHRARRPTARP
jgi:hypothetical protein